MKKTNKGKYQAVNALINMRANKVYKIKVILPFLLSRDKM